MPSCVWVDKKLIFIHPEKTGGNSVYYGLLPHLGPGDFDGSVYPHRSLSSIQDQYNRPFDDYLKVMTVRCPFERVKSLVKWHRSHGHQEYPIEYAVQLLTPLIDYGACEMDQWLNISNLAEDIEPLCEKFNIPWDDELHLNKSKDYDIYLTPDQITRVFERFEWDFKFAGAYGWKFDLQFGKAIYRTFDEKGFPNGHLATLWNRNYQDWKPDQVYLTTVGPGKRKGPHLHHIRTGRFFCIQGRATVVLRDENGYHKISATYRDPRMIEIPTGTACEIVNMYPEPALFLNMPSPAWTPDMDDENYVDNWSPPI
jgi:dTDP-4-dehydrorhamnose 3,5-epimerase-like enzyme